MPGGHLTNCMSVESQEFSDWFIPISHVVGINVSCRTYWLLLSAVWRNRYFDRGKCIWFLRFE